MLAAVKRKRSWKPKSSTMKVAENKCGFTKKQPVAKRGPDGTCSIRQYDKGYTETVGSKERWQQGAAPSILSNILFIWRNPSQGRKSTMTIIVVALIFSTSPTKRDLEIWMFKARNLSAMMLESYAWMKGQNKQPGKYIMSASQIQLGPKLSLGGECYCLPQRGEGRHSWLMEIYIKASNYLIRSWKYWRRWQQVHIVDMQFGFIPGRGTTDVIFVVR